MNNKLCLPNGICCRPGVYRWCQMCRAYRVAKSTFAHDILYVACSSVDLSKLLTMGVDKGSSPSLIHCSGGASAVKEPGHFEVRKSSSQVTRMHFFLEKSWRPVRYGNIFFIFCPHYYRSKAIRRARQGGAKAWARAWSRTVELPAGSYDLARPGVAPPLIHWSRIHK